MKTFDLNALNVRPKRCKTCSFNPDGVEDLREKVKQRCTTEGNQICHTSQSENIKLQVCRGSRDYQLEVFSRWGWIEAPTDEAYAKRLLK